MLFYFFHFITQTLIGIKKPKEHGTLCSKKDINIPVNVGGFVAFFANTGKFANAVAMFF